MYHQQSFGKQSFQQSNIKNFINMIKNCGNPQQMLEQTVKENPQLGIINLLQENGGNAKQAFYSYAKQKGINPDDIINMLK